MTKMNKCYPDIVSRGLLTVILLFLFRAMAMAQTLTTSWPGSGTETDPYIMPPATYGTPYDNLMFSAISGPGDYSALNFSIPSSTGISVIPNVLFALQGTPTATGTFSIIGTFNPQGLGPYIYYQLTIAPVPLQVAVSSATKAYGAAMPTLTFSVSGYVNGDDASTTFVGTPTATTAATSSSPVGNYAIQVSNDNLDAPNYTITYVDGTLTVNPVPLTITANNSGTSYGVAPKLTVYYNGFVNGDNDSSLTKAPTLTTNATSVSSVGVYTITAAGAVDANYTISYGRAGILIISPAPLEISASGSMTYGGPVPPLTIAYNGFVNGEDSSILTSQPTATTTATSTSPAGSYPITISGAADPNYQITYPASTVTVAKAALTVTADDATMPYGGPLPVLTVSYSGFVNGDSASSIRPQPTASTMAMGSAPVGTYTITPNGGSSSNYTFTYVNGNLTVEQGTLSITANPGSSVYGAALVPDTSLTVTYSGFVNGDNAGLLTTAPVVTNTAYAGAPAGAYTLTPSGAADPNYNIQYVAGTYTITPANLTITPATDTMIYGSDVPTLNLNYTGFVNGEGPGNLWAMANVSTTATSSSPVGTYPISASGAADTNYAFTYVPGTLTIDPASLNVAADTETKVYGEPDPSLQYTFSGLAGGDNTSIFTGSLSRDPGENVGIYAITQGTLSAGDNYVVKFTGNDLTITKAQQQISWGQRLLFGCDNTTQFQLTATASSGLPVTYTTSSSAVATVVGDMLTLVQPGSVLITASQAGNGNYFAAADVTDSAVDQTPSLVRQHWGDVLFFDNSSDSFVQWQWYKNGNAIPGATSAYYSEMPSLNGQYYVIATENTGGTIQTCPLTITGGGAVAGGIAVYPNPASGGASVTVTCDYTAAALQGSLLQIVDMQGKVWQRITNVQPSMKVTMPTAGGIYIISLELSSGQKATVNVLIND